MFLPLSDINEIQLDHTSRCNLLCPQCARVKDDWYKVKENKGLDLTLSDYKILLEPFEEERLKIFHCGNYGDALASPTFDETFDFTLDKKPKRIVITTNGSLRNKNWWEDLAEKAGSRLLVVFSIDGLEDSNPIYRVGSQFNKIIENAKAFIRAGGKARWDFIEFKHNYHQIEQARQMAHDLGFSLFNVKYTSRFAAESKVAELKKDGNEIKDRSTNKNQKDFREIKQQYGSFNEYVAKTKISCKSKANRNVFVDMHMRVWPCCWFGAPSYFVHKTQQTESFDHIHKLYGTTFNSLRHHGWELLEHDFFKNYLENSWENPDNQYRRVFTCGRTCGEKFEFSSGYGQNKNVQVLKNSVEA